MKVDGLDGGEGESRRVPPQRRRAGNFARVAAYFFTSTMSATTLGRRCTTQVRRTTRALTSSSKVPPSPSTPTAQAYLTDKNRRKLIELYHSSKTFVTPETLSARIDVALTTKTVSTPSTFADTDPEDRAFRQLRTTVNVMRMAPRTLTPSQMNMPGDDAAGVGLWSYGSNKVNARVKQAILGQDVSWAPGLEMVLKLARERRALHAELGLDAPGQLEGGEAQAGPAKDANTRPKQQWNKNWKRSSK